MLDTRAYLGRIGYHGPLEPTAATLAALHDAHLLSVPFEDLDIHLHRPIVLEETALFAKIVERRRGGFCYELNGLFAALLRELGFRVTLLAAEVAREGGFSPEFDHLALLVELEQRWLADVGFGECFRLPLRLDEAADQLQGEDVWRIASDGPYRTLLRRGGEGGWKPQYRFTPTPRRLADFEDRCRYHQTSPESHFTQNRLCTRATPDGRITLSGARLIHTAGGRRTEGELANEAEYADALQRWFGIRACNPHPF